MNHIVKIIYLLLVAISFLFLTKCASNIAFIISPIYFLVWVFIEKKIPLEYKPLHYIVALILSSIAITMASLSFEETKRIMEVSTFETYFWNKIVFNILGWVGLPLVTTKLIKLAKP